MARRFSTPHGPGLDHVPAKAAWTRPPVIRLTGTIRISIDPEKLDAEMRRVFDICHGCRRCFNLCDSFPRLFDLIDDSPDRRTRRRRNRKISKRRGGLHAVRHVFHDQVPLCSAASIRSRFSPSDAALSRGGSPGRQNRFHGAPIGRDGSQWPVARAVSRRLPISPRAAKRLSYVR